MKYEWIKAKTPGIRYREHPTRKHGSVRKDRYYTIRYKLNGKTKEEALGWESEGWTENKVAARLHELKENQRTGDGEVTLSDKRKKEEIKRKSDEENRIKKQQEQVSFNEIFLKYIELAKKEKTERSYRTEEGLFKKWISPTIGDTPMKDISPFALEKLKDKMKKANLSPRSISYALAVIRQVFNYAKRFELYNGDNPTGKVKKPTEDNRRDRFLTHKEAELLLQKLKESSVTVHDMALLSLHCGLRRGEIISLTWNDVDFDNGFLFIKDAKNGKNRKAIMTEDVRFMLEERKKVAINNHVFTTAKGEPISDISKTFPRVVETLGFNKGITDKRQQVVFHTLRHTYASWLVMSGVDLYTVQRLMGHSTIAMTERYSHLAPDYLKKAVKTFEANFSEQKKDGKLIYL